MRLDVVHFVPVMLGVLWPARCAACGRPVPEGISFCPGCARDLLPLGACCPGCAMPQEPGTGARCRGCLRDPLPFFEAAAALAYGGSLTQAILRFKHGGHRHLAAPLARYLFPVIAQPWDGADLVCPVPLHRIRLKQRGFNQALELVRASGTSARRSGTAKVVCDLLERIVDTPALAHGSPARRAQAVAGAFALPRPARVAGKHVLVVDDVMTSGATLAECARTLLRAGAKKVSVAALARAI